MDKIGEFRTFRIVRNCQKTYSDYRSYKSYLKIDFQNRCAYCNVSDDQITTYFEVDHFVPRKICETYSRSDLITDYNNLIYSCKKCNLAKSNLYDGSRIPTELFNGRFYNPVDVDYNDIFYRNTIGGIDSNDIKGRNMIVDLKLYRVIHNYAWISERLDFVRTLINLKIDKLSSDDPKYVKLLEVYRLISNEASKYQKLFLKMYNK